MYKTTDVAKINDGKEARAVTGAEVIVATTIGHAMEFFDFTAYNFFAILIGRFFFTLSPIFQLVMSTGTFAAGFFFRPLGGVLIGVYADRNGRKAALTMTVVLMALSSAMIRLVPTCEEIGICAPLVILLSRILQGISAGVGRCFYSIAGGIRWTRPARVLWQLPVRESMFGGFAWRRNERFVITIYRCGFSCFVGLENCIPDGNRDRTGWNLHSSSIIRDAASKPMERK